MNKLKGKIIYAFIFCLVLPLLLILWAKLTEDVIILSVPNNLWLGILFCGMGFILMLKSMRDLWTYGGGLPMNAYPPKRFVSKGFYGFISHPIYTGACFLSIGLSICFQSRSGFWLVTPVLILSCLALIYGFENKHIKELYKVKNLRTKFSIDPTDQKPSSNDIISVIVNPFLFWFFIFELKIFMDISPKAIDTNFYFENTWPVFELAEIPYIIIYPFVVLFPFFCRTKKILLEFKQQAVWCTLIGVFFIFLLPFVSTFRSFEPSSILGKWLLWEQHMDSPAAAFPSFHVIWSLVAATAYSASFPRQKYLWWFLSFSIMASCSLTGMHSLLDILAGAFLYILILFRKRILAEVQKISEKFANGWREWHIGPLRIINHSLWAGLACITGMVIAQSVLHNINLLVIVCFASFVGAALWGQLVEGSPKLLRPFGYYGGILGGTIGVAISCMIFNASLVNIFVALALAAPWVQAVGRVRCWIQGCCHGHETEDSFGIRYFHERSRVCTVSNMKGKMLHNTQWYSIIANVIIGLVLIRLAWSEVSPSLICGLYFILNGLARFVEESYRGESQTKTLYGLRLYQWMAIISAISGIIFTSIPATSIANFHFALSLNDILVITGSGLFAAFAMGMDFPKKNFRFARLTSD
jgi:protein-S-isoprenylcysteine O-methyltransferase Ste14